MSEESSAGPRVAVVIPCHNDSATVEESVQSALDQEPCELVVVDDGSTEVATISTLDRLEERGVRVLRQENRGVCAARMAGVHATSAPYVLPLDGDDLLVPGVVTRLADALDAHAEAAAAWGDFELFGDTRARFRTPDRLDPWLVTIINQYSTTALFRRTTLEDVGGWRSRLGYDDWSLWIALAERGYDGVRIPGITYRYRIQSGRKWRTKSLRRHDAISAEFRSLYPSIYARREENRARSPVARTKKMALSLLSDATFLPARPRVALINLVVRPRPVLQAASMRRWTGFQRWRHSRTKTAAG
jgi:glycosyltransferase involved in cell wall biosynthesis